MTFSNPRLTAEFDKWPIGGSNYGKCKFTTEVNNKGTRISRTTTDKFGNWNKPKLTTYEPHSCIVDGNDGKTYILQTTIYNFIKILRHDFMTHQTISDKDEQYETILNLIRNAK